MDPELAEIMRAEVVGVPAARKLKDAPFDERALLPMLIGSMAHQDRLALIEDLSGRLLGGLPPAGFAAGLLLICILLLSLRGGPRGASTACTRCGAPARRTATEPHCETCRFVFLEATSAEPKVRFKKEQEIRRRRRFERWREKLLSVVAGGGELVSGHPLVGFALSFTLCFAVAHVLWLGRFGFYPWPGWSEPESARLAVSGTLALVATFISLRRAFGS